MPESTNSPQPEISPDDEDVRVMMRNSGLTARTLAARIGVSESAMSRWVAGYRNPMDARVEAMAKVLGKTPEQIRRGFQVSRLRGRTSDAPSDDEPSS
jgi:transcriptional regulator with XRE-family HTH domain